MYQSQNLAEKSNREFYKGIYIKAKIVREWCEYGHWKEAGKQCEVCVFDHDDHLTTDEGCTCK